MANNTTGFGILEFGRTEGGSPTAGQTRVFLASTDARPIFNGDPVKLSSATPGVVEWSSAAAQGNTVGIFYGCKFLNTSVGRVIWSRTFPGSVSASAGDRTEAYIVDDPERWFIAKSTGTFTQANVGQNVSFTPSSVGDIAGGSLATLSIGTVTGLSSVPGTFKIVDLYSNLAPPGADGAFATAGNVVVVTGNNFGRNNLTGTTSA